MITETLDTKGLNCPLPILKTKKAIAKLAGGETLEVLSTDPGSAQDFEAFARATGHKIVEAEEAGGVFRFLIEKKAG